VTNGTPHMRIVRPLVALLLALGLLAGTVVESWAAKKMSCENLGWDNLGWDCTQTVQAKKK
jgi:hypothetical protein